MDFPARPNSTVLRLGDEAVMKFIDLCRREECLWNSNIPDYRNKEKRQQAIVDIARELNISYFGPQHVWLKLKNLRNTYCQELKKISTSGGTYTPKVIWFSKIDEFLKPHIKGACVIPLEKTSKPDLLIVKQEEDSDVDSDDTPLALSASLKSEVISQDEAPGWWPHVGPAFSKQEPREPSPNKSEHIGPAFPKQELPELSPNRSEHIGPAFSKQELRQPSPKSQEESEDAHFSEPNTTNKRPIEDTPNVMFKRQRVLEYDTEQIVASLNHISEQVQRLRPHADIFDRFGRYIASLLRSLPRKKSLLLQPQIINLITVSAALNLADRPLP